MKYVKDSKSPAQNNNAKQTNLQRPRGTTPKTKGGGMSDEQFNKGKSYDSDDASNSSLGSASVDSDPSSVSSVGSADMGDKQFTGKSGKFGDGSKLSKKSSGGTPGKFDGQKLHPAAAIMREVAKASMKADSHPSQYQGSKKVSNPKSQSQTTSYKNSSNTNPQARSKTQLTQKLKKA